MNPHTNQGHTLYFSAKSTSPCYGVGVKKEYIASSSVQTKKIARSLAPLILKKQAQKHALIIALEGELGSGKTTFLQGFARGLGIKEKILSPTFIIYKKLQIPNSKSQTNSKFYFYHIDCYRIKKPKELLDLNFKELSSNPQNIIVIEWADKIKKIIPRNTLWLKFEFINEKTRKITFRNFQLYATIKKWQKRKKKIRKG